MKKAYFKANKLRKYTSSVPIAQYKSAINLFNSNTHIFFFLYGLTHTHRDTPHHLKNKRVQQGLLNDKATTLLITHAIQKQNEQKKLKEISIPEVAEADAEADAKGEPIENSMEQGDHIANGKLNIFYLFFEIAIFVKPRKTISGMYD